MTLLKSLILCFICLLCTGIHAQVTIGSPEFPAFGALLDLKENNVTTKGLGMPRVKLTNLTPDNSTELAASIGGAGSWELNEHTALVVYNVEESLCVTDPIYKGLYIFDGDRWEFLGERAAHYYNDNRPQQLGSQTYPYRTFGAAGDWMLENMRYLPPVGDPIQFIASIGNEFTYDPTDKFYTYPNVDPIDPAVAPATWSKEQGLLYTYSAATLGAQDGLDLDQGQGLPDEGPATPIQGICPPNWHIPSDREWNQLEKELYNHADRYSSYTLADLPFTATYNPPLGILSGWQMAWESGSGLATNDPPASIEATGMRGSTTTDGHGLAMLSPCELPGSTEGATGGKSLSTEQGGFNVLLVGQAGRNTIIEYGSSVYFWASSSYFDFNSWMRGIERQTPMVIRGMSGRGALDPVRCKRN